jgi:hypothetical protein
MKILTFDLHLAWCISQGLSLTGAIVRCETRRQSNTACFFPLISIIGSRRCLSFVWWRSDLRFDLITWSDILRWLINRTIRSLVHDLQQSRSYRCLLLSTVLQLTESMQMTTRLIVNTKIFSKTIKFVEIAMFSRESFEIKPPASGNPERGRFNPDTAT